MAERGFIADVGGTNIRLAVTGPESDSLGEIRKYQCGDYLSILDVIEVFLKEENKDVHHACIAVACPVDQDEINLTNNHWRFSVKELQEQLGLKSLHMINDYTAIAMSIPYLKDNQVVKIGKGTSIAKKPIAVCGPGTGLGVAMLLYHNGQWICLDGEGGHVEFAPQNDLEDYLLKNLRTEFSHVSAERFITGPGLVNLYNGIKSFNNEDSESLKPAEITQKALENKDDACRLALETFYSLLGAFAGNLALTGWTSGGVYIAGGIAPRMIDFISNSRFRERFEAKGRFEDSISKIPTYIITEQQPGLIGAAAYLRQALGW